MDIKLIFALASVVIGAISYYPYLRDIFSRKTRPHAYTWLIWSLTQGTAALAVWTAGGGWSAWSMGAGALMVIVIFFLSLKFGTRNITKSDTIVLVLTLLAIIVWWQLNNVLLAVLMVTAIDFFGYLPSFRKTYQAPWSETIRTWLGFMLSYGILNLLALKDYNLISTIYLIMVTVANGTLALICISRRPLVNKPQ